MAHWWGITDQDFVGHCISGVVDMEGDLYDDRIESKSLQEMCAAILNKDLPKLKERYATAKKQKRKKGHRVKTSHWRRDDLTKDMKEYASNDVSSAIDIYLEVMKVDADEEEKTGS